MAIGEQGNFDQGQQGDQNAGKQGNQNEGLYVRVQAEGQGKGPFSGGASSTVKGLLNNLEIEQTQATPRTRPDAQPEARTRPDAQPEARTRPEAQQAQGGERDVQGPNGSKIHLSSKFPDGKERVTEVTEPDGVRHAYRWQDVNGKVICTAIADLTPQGQLAAGSRLMQDQQTWKIKAGNYPEMSVQGSVTIDSDGTHRFREANGNTFTRKPDGSATYTDGNGRNIPGHPLVRGPKEFQPAIRPKK